MTASARWLLSACESLDGVLAAEGISSLPDPDEPGAVLCRTARNVILAWRQPSGTGDGAVLSPSVASLPRLGIVAALYPSAERSQQYAIRFPGEVNAMPFTGSEIEPAAPFQPARTRQGTVASLAEAEEVLISTAARIQISHLHRTRPARAGIQDRHLLASALGQACGLTPQEMLRQAEIQVTATVRRELAMQAAADLGREHARAGTRPFETELETAARLEDVLREKGCALPGDDPSPRELLWEYRFAFGYEKAGLHRPRPSRSHRDAASPAELAGRDFPAPAGRPLSAPAESRLAVSTLHSPRGLNQANGRQHR